MNKERLQEILELKNAHKIEHELIDKENYFDMEKSVELREADFVPVFQSDSYVSLDAVEDAKYMYVMGFADNVSAYPNYIFVWLQVNKYASFNKTWLIHKLKMYAKEK